MTTAEAQHFEYRTIGPPGCGKTTWITEQVRQACEAQRNPMVISLTKAAASEVVQRDLPVPRHQVGTLHSQCYYALGRPPIAEDKDNITAWNDSHPEYAITPTHTKSTASGDTPPPDGPGEAPGDWLMSQYQALRARRTPRRQYPDKIALFAGRWEDWKANASLMDFNDLIERGLSDVDQAPGEPDIIFVDEAQDMSALEIALARKWGEPAGMLVLVGDPDQNIYSWRGSDPDAFAHPQIPDDHWRLLSQSYRVPQAVHRKAVPWITNCRNRQPVEYQPTPNPGHIGVLNTTWQRPEPLIQDLETQLAQDRSVMIIGSCAYMLQHLTTSLRNAGIPFHNPQRNGNGAWNPLQRREGQTASVDRLLSFLKVWETGELWSAEETRTFCEVLKLTGVISGSKRQKRLDALTNDRSDPDEGDTLSWDAIAELLTEPAVEAALSGDVNWYLGNAKSTAASALEYPARIIAKRGLDEVRHAPTLTIGTIHSVKGSEADVVYLLPDLSYAGMREMHGTAEQKNAIYRLFYVGMTRTRESLILCQPADGNHAPII